MSKFTDRLRQISDSQTSPVSEVNQDSFIDRLRKLANSPASSPETMSPVGIGEYFSRFSDPAHFVPVIGGLMSSSTDIKNKMDYLKNGIPKYTAPPAPVYGQPSNPERLPLTEEEKKQYTKDIENYFSKAAELQERGLSIPAQITSTIAEMIPYMAEFITTSPLRSLFSKAGSKSVEYWIGKGVSSKLIGGMAGAVGTMAGTGSRAISDKSRKELEGIDSATAAWKAFLGNYIDNLSELSGGAITKSGGWVLRKLGAGKVIDTLARLSGKSSKEVSDLLAKSEYHGILGEIGEERLADFLKGMTGVETWSNAIPSLTQMLIVEPVAFSVPGLAGKAFDKINRSAKPYISPEDALRQKGQEFSKDLMKNVPPKQSKPIPVTDADVEKWALHNWNSATELSKIENPSRKDFQNLGFELADQPTRKQFQVKVKDIVETRTPEELQANQQQIDEKLLRKHLQQKTLSSMVDWFDTLQERPTVNQVREKFNIPSKKEARQYINDFFGELPNYEKMSWDQLKSKAKELGITKIIGIKRNDLINKMMSIEQSPPKEEPANVPEKEGNLFHGSPYDFNEFDLSNIGKGEGSWDHGHGIYLSNIKEIAGGYLKNDSGFLYKVKLSKIENNWLDWDKPITEKTKSKLLSSLEKEKIDELTLNWLKKEKRILGSSIYGIISRELGSNKKASEFLLHNGIDGTRYPDNTMGKKGFNYVVFDEKSISITGKEPANVPKKEGEITPAIQEEPPLPENDLSKTFGSKETGTADLVYSDNPLRSGKPGLELTRIKASKAGSGKGTKLLEQAKEYANEQGLPIVLEARAYPGGVLSQDRLVKWYEDHGFKVIYKTEDASIMIYEPKGKEQANGLQEKKGQVTPAEAETPPPVPLPTEPKYPRQLIEDNAIPLGIPVEGRSDADILKDIDAAFTEPTQPANTFEEAPRKPIDSTTAFSDVYTGKTKNTVESNAPRTAIFNLSDLVELSQAINEGKIPGVVEKIRGNKDLSGIFQSNEETGKITIRADVAIGPKILEGTVKGENREAEIESLRQELKDKYDLGDNDIKVVTKEEGNKTHVTFYQKDPDYAAKVLSHEIGHLVDWLPDKTLKRGNILGHIATLKKYLKHKLDSFPGSNEKISRKEIMDELKSISRWWKPFDEKADPKYTKYRDSSKELYADAISVLLNNPAALAEKAPKFHQALMDWMSKKPAVKKTYDRIVMEIESGLNHKRLVQDTRKMMTEGDKELIKSLSKENTITDQVSKRLGTLLVDTAWTIKGLSRDVQSEFGISPQKNPEYAIETMVYTGGEKRNYIENMLYDIQKPLDAQNISWDLFGEYLLHKRVTGERSELLNPLGWNKELSTSRMREIEQELGTERAQQLKNIVKRFEDNHQTIVSKIKNEHFGSKEFLEYAKNNDDYATFWVYKFNQESGGTDGTGISSHLFHQVGTLQKIANPATATILKDLSLISSINRNSAKRVTIDFLKEFYPEELKDSEKRFNGKAQVPVETKEKGKSTIMFLRDGKLESYDVDRWLATQFETTEPELLRWTASVAHAIAVPFRMLFTIVRPGFWAYNALRDYGRTAHNLPGLTLMKELPYYLRSLPSAWRSAFGKPDALISEMNKNNALISVANYDGLSKTDFSNEKLLSLYAKKARTWDEKVRHPFSTLYQSFTNVGEMIETIPKVAGWKYLTETHPELSMEEIAHIVRTQAGSPPFLIKGKATPLINNILLYSNPAIQGWRYDYRAFKGNKAEFTWKLTKYMVLPKVLMWSLASGGMLTMYKNLFNRDEKDDKVAKTLRNIKRIYDGVSEYDMTNYFVFPMGITPEGKSIYGRLPANETERFFGGIAHKMLNLETQGWTSVFDYTAQQLPSMNPAIELISSTWTYLFGGRPPYDELRGRYVVPENIYGNNWESHKRMAQWLWNQAGLSMIHKWQPEEFAPGTLAIEKAGRTPVVSDIVSRFVKVSDYGLSEKLKQATKEVDTKRQNELIMERSIAEKQARGKELSPDENAYLQTNPESLKSKQKQMKGLVGADAYQRAFMFAKTSDEKTAIIKKVYELEGPSFKENPIFRDFIGSRLLDATDPMNFNESDFRYDLKAEGITAESDIRKRIAAEKERLAQKREEKPEAIIQELRDMGITDPKEMETIMRLKFADQNKIDPAHGWTRSFKKRLARLRNLLKKNT